MKDKNCPFLPVGGLLQLLSNNLRKMLIVVENQNIGGKRKAYQQKV